MQEFLNHAGPDLTLALAVIEAAKRVLADEGSLEYHRAEPNPGGPDVCAGCGDYAHSCPVVALRLALDAWEEGE